MSSIKTYLFTDALTGELLFAKRSLKYDYDFEMPGVEVKTEEFLEKIPNIKLTSERALFLRRKIEALIFIRTAQLMMEDAIEQSLDARRIETIGLSEPAKVTYKNLMANERELTTLRVQNFFQTKYEKIVALDTDLALTYFMKEISDRVNLGVYSVMNQERKKLDAYEPVLNP